MTEITDVTRLFRELAPNFDLEMGKKKQGLRQESKMQATPESSQIFQ